jgi:RNA polymerase sigma factor (sigma-70 family)
MDDDQFVAQVQPHIAAAVRVASALVGMADAEDAAQEAFVRAWKAWPDLRDAGAVRPWLLRIVVNVCQSWLRGSFGSRRRTVSLADDLPLLDEALGTIAHAEVLDLAAAIVTLDESLRIVVQLRYFAGLDATEIGAVLHLPSATVRTRLRRALTLLRHTLQSDALTPSPESLEAEP